VCIADPLIGKHRSARICVPDSYPKEEFAMIKLHTVVAGTAIAVFAQFAGAQTNAAPMAAPAASDMHASDPAYTDQSRLNQTKDPYVKKRIASKQAKKQYKAEKKAAKHEYKEDKAAAKKEMRAANKDARETRKEELAHPAPMDNSMPGMGK
jgi:hypothetical protein